MPYGTGSFGALAYGGDFETAPAAADETHNGYWWWGPGHQQIFLDLIYHRFCLKDLKD